MQTTIVAELAVETQKEAVAAIPAKLLMDTLSNTPEQPITFTVDEDTYGAIITTETGRFRIAGENPVDFPLLPKVAEASSLTLPAAVLLRAISTTLFAASTDDNRPAMGGVFFKMEEDKSTFVATDGHRLVRYSRTDILAAEETQFILPRKGLAFLRSTLPNDQTSIALTFNQSNACFAFGSTQVFCRLVDERFPDYQGVIPLQNPNQLIIERMELLGALRRLMPFASRSTHQVRFKLTDKQVTLSAEDVDYSNDANERLACDYNGDPMEIGFNARMMSELLSNMDSNLVTVNMSAPNRAGIILPRQQEENEDLLMLVMPIMLSSYVPA
jgi:DNA polymerase-3 subunit beta